MGGVQDMDAGAEIGAEVGAEVAAPSLRPGKMRSRSYRELWDRPGYLVRRLHQIHQGMFAEECGKYDLTPVQYGMLTVLRRGEEMDQLTLSSSVGVDRTSGADVVKRLVARGLLRREPSRVDRRAKIIRITEAGRALVEQVRPDMTRAQERLLAPLSAEEQKLFEELLRRLVEANNDASRAPMG